MFVVRDLEVYDRQGFTNISRHECELVKIMAWKIARWLKLLGGALLCCAVAAIANLKFKFNKTFIF